MNTHIGTFEQLTTKELYNIYKLRADTFIVEQQCPYHEIDHIDLESHHVYLRQGKDVLTYCRLCKQDDAYHIRRVITSPRRKGYGTQIMKTAIKFAVNILHTQSINVEARTYAQQFYEKLGFVIASESFDEDGIQHIKTKYTIEQIYTKKI